MKPSPLLIGVPVLLLTGGLCARATIIPYSADANTVLLYHFDEGPGGTNLADASGNGMALTATASPLAGTPGPDGLGGSGSFTEGNGNLQFTGIPSTPQLGLFSTSAFTIEAWIRNPDQQASAAPDDHDGIFQLRNGNLNRMELTILDKGAGANAGKIRLTFNRLDNGVFAFAEAPAFTWEQDVWYHLAATYDSNTGGANDSVVQFYIDRADDFDGVPNLYQTLNNVPDIAAVTDGAVLRIGGFDGINNRNFGGDIDEVRFSNTVRTGFNLAVVPEPGTAGLLFIGCVLLGRFRRSAG